jgi:hypothetical protein
MPPARVTNFTAGHGPGNAGTTAPPDVAARTQAPRSSAKSRTVSRSACLSSRVSRPVQRCTTLTPAPSSGRSPFTPPAPNRSTGEPRRGCGRAVTARSPGPLLRTSPEPTPRSAGAPAGLPTLPPRTGRPATDPGRSGDTAVGPGHTCPGRPRAHRNRQTPPRQGSPTSGGTRAVSCVSPQVPSDVRASARTDPSAPHQRMRGKFLLFGRNLAAANRLSRHSSCAHRGPHRRLPGRSWPRWSRSRHAGRWCASRGHGLSRG